MGFFDDVDVTTIPVNSKSERREKRLVQEQSEVCMKAQNHVQKTVETGKATSSEMELENKLGEDLINELMPFSEEENSKNMHTDNKVFMKENENVFEDTTNLKKNSAVKNVVEKEDRIAPKNLEKIAEQSTNVMRKENLGKEKGKIPCTETDTIIGVGTTLFGDMSSDNNVLIYGTVKGEIISKGDIILHDNAKSGCLATSKSVMVYGTTTGDISGADRIYVGTHGKVMNGSLNCDGSIEIDNGAVVVGNIFCQKPVMISGAVKGDIESSEKVVLKSTAIIKGNIKSASIVIEEGAAIDGTCTQTNTSRVTPDDFFTAIESDDQEDNL